MASDRPESGALPQTGAGTYTAFRYCDYDTPFWARGNSRAGRWHNLGDPPTQYWCLCPEAAWAELIRAEGLTSEAELDLVRMPMWVCRVPMLGLIDLRDGSAQDHYGITWNQIVEDDHQACRAINAGLRADARGILSESAALPGHTNLTLFGGMRAVDWHVRPTLRSTLATTRVAIGRPPPGLLRQVRHPVGPLPQGELF